MRLLYEQPFFIEKGHEIAQFEPIEQMRIFSWKFNPFRVVRGNDVHTHGFQPRLLKSDPFQGQGVKIPIEEENTVLINPSTDQTIKQSNNQPINKYI